jgi:hypothetical protein
MTGRLLKHLYELKHLLSVFAVHVSLGEKVALGLEPVAGTDILQHHGMVEYRKQHILRISKETERRLGIRMITAATLPSTSLGSPNHYCFAASQTEGRKKIKQSGLENYSRIWVGLVRDRML